MWVRLRRGGILRRRVKASRGVGGRQGGAGRLSAPGRAIGARRARARSLRLPGPAWVRSCSTAAGGATAHGSPAPGAAALAPAACRGEGGRAVACRLVVAGARWRPGALSSLRETQPVVPHCAGEVRGVEERARAACGDGGGDGPTRHGAGVASVGVAVARVAPGQERSVAAILTPGSAAEAEGGAAGGCCVDEVHRLGVRHAPVEAGSSLCWLCALGARPAGPEEFSAPPTLLPPGPFCFFRFLTL